MRMMSGEIDCWFAFGIFFLIPAGLALRHGVLGGENGGRLSLCFPSSLKL